MTSDPKYQTRRPRRAIKADRVHPRDLRQYVVTEQDGRQVLGGFFCEACSHFSNDPEKGPTCTLGYRAQHLLAEQLRIYNLTGTLVLCRAIEID